MRPASVTARAVVLLLARILVLAGPVCAAEIKVMTSGAFSGAYLELAPQFERATRNRIVTTTTSMGTGADSIPNRLQRGEAADVVIMADAAFDELIQGGRVLAGSRVALARSGIGMAVRAGAPKPDIRSVEALRRTLLEAKSIAYSNSVSGSYLSSELFPLLGIADQIGPKSRRIDRERVGAVVARGEAEIGFQQVSELLPIKGIDYAGPLPDEVQRVTVFSAGVAAGTKNPDAARALIRFLASPDAARVIAKSGMEPVSKTFHLVEATIEDIHGAFRSGQLTCRKLVEHYLDRISAYDKSGPGLNAIQSVNSRALQEAELLDGAFAASGPVGSLHCIPVLVKDQLDTADMPTTYGSAVFKDFRPDGDATVVSKLRKAAQSLSRRRRWVNLRPGFSDPRRGRFTTLTIRGAMRAALRGEPGQGSRQTWAQWESARTREARCVVRRR
jgi:molybdate transport system substrate-binding protein